MVACVPCAVASEDPVADILRHRRQRRAGPRPPEYTDPDIVHAISPFSGLQSTIHLTAYCHISRYLAIARTAASMFSIGVPG